MAFGNFRFSASSLGLGAMLSYCILEPQWLGDGLKDPGFETRKVYEIFLSSKSPRQSLPLPLLKLSYSVVTGDKAAGTWCWTHPFFVVVENAWRYTSTPLYSFMAWTMSTLSLLFTTPPPKFCSFNTKLFFHLVTEVLTHFFELRPSGKRKSVSQAFQQADKLL